VTDATRAPGTSSRLEPAVTLEGAGSAGPAVCECRSWWVVAGSGSPLSPLGWHAYRFHLGAGHSIRLPGGAAVPPVQLGLEAGP